MHSEQFEGSGRHASADDLLGLVDARQLERPAPIGHHPGERSRRIAHDLEVRGRELELGDWRTRHSFEQRDEPLRVFVGQAPQEHAIDNREDRGVRADPDGQRQDRNERERRMPAKVPQGVPDIGRQLRHVFARRGSNDADDRVPPERERAPAATSIHHRLPMIAKRLCHVIAEVSAEFRREQPEQTPEHAIRSRHSAASPVRRDGRAPSSWQRPASVRAARPRQARRHARMA